MKIPSNISLAIALIFWVITGWLFAIDSTFGIFEWFAYVILGLIVVWGSATVLDIQLKIGDKLVRILKRKDRI